MLKATGLIFTFIVLNDSHVEPGNNERTSVSMFGRRSSYVVEL